MHSFHQPNTPIPASHSQELTKHADKKRPVGRHGKGPKQKRAHASRGAGVTRSGMTSRRATRSTQLSPAATAGSRQRPAPASHAGTGACGLRCAHTRLHRRAPRVLASPLSRSRRTNQTLHTAGGALVGPRAPGSRGVFIFFLFYLIYMHGTPGVLPYC
jgi:hypothetical protein